MRRIEVFREGNMMGALIGPDLVVGLGGFGETSAEALRDLADLFEEHHYAIAGNQVAVEVRGKLVSAEGKTPADAIRKLAWIVAERGYTEEDFAPLNWTRIAAETPLVSTGASIRPRRP
jgi:hypothetical protein